MINKRNQMTESLINNDKLVELNGYLTSINVSEVQKDLEMALSQISKLTIDITGLIKLDVVGVFMLLILKNKAITNGKNIVILNNGNEVVTQAIKNSGIKNIVDVI